MTKMHFGRKLFGLNPQEVYEEFKNTEENHNKFMENLTREVERARESLATLEKDNRNLINQLAMYQEREQLISQVLVTAQLNAQKIEYEARENARTMMEKCTEELRIKNLELDRMKSKVLRFKEEFKEVLDKYRYSIETMKEISGDVNPSPTHFHSDKIRYINNEA